MKNTPNKVSTFLLRITVYILARISSLGTFFKKDKKIRTIIKQMHSRGSHYVEGSREEHYEDDSGRVRWEIVEGGGYTSPTEDSYWAIRKLHEMGSNAKPAIHNLLIEFCRKDARKYEIIKALGAIGIEHKYEKLIFKQIARYNYWDLANNALEQLKKNNIDIKENIISFCLRALMSPVLVVILMWLALIPYGIVAGTFVVGFWALSSLYKAPIILHVAFGLAVLIYFILISIVSKTAVVDMMGIDTYNKNQNFGVTVFLSAVFGGLTIFLFWLGAHYIIPILFVEETVFPKEILMLIFGSGLTAILCLLINSLLSIILSIREVVKIHEKNKN